MTRLTRIRLSVGGFLLAASMGLILWPVDAEAKGYATPQAPCEQVGATAKARNGETYRCEQRKGDLCPKWHWMYRPGKPKGSWTPRPGSPCVQCSPSPSASASPSATVATTHSSSPKPVTSSTTAAPQGGTTSTPGGEDYNNHPGMLPVTGTAENVAAFAAIIGALLILLGVTAIAITKPWRRYDT